MSDSVLRLVQQQVSAETVELLRFWLAEAEAGRIVGVIGGCVHPGRRYSVDFAGECRTEVIFSRGILLVADDRLAVLIGSREPPSSSA